MNININISEVLTKAWKISWKFKVLWIFGILAGCGANNRASFNNSFGNGSNSNWNENFGDGANLPEPFRRFQNMNWQEAINSFMSQYLAIIIVVLCLLCVLWLLLYFLGVMGKTGLINGARKADAGAERLGFGELWNESLPYFWRIFGLSLLVGLPFFIIFAILLVVLLVGVFGLATNTESGAAMGGVLAALGVFIPAVCCLSIVSIIVNMIVEQAKNALVVEDIGILESLRRGWDVFKRNFVTIILMSIILGVLSGIVGFIVAIPLLLALAPALGSIAMLAAGSKETVAFAPAALTVLCCAAYAPVLLVLHGIEQTYVQSAWTLTYLRLTAPAPETPAKALETADAQ